MKDVMIFEAILDSLKDEVICFIDTEHVVRYMNKPAIRFYEGGESLIGNSVFSCHKEESKHKLLELFERLCAGEDEILFSQEEDTWFYLRAVRDPEGTLLGYYEHLYHPQE